MYDYYKLLLWSERVFRLLISFDFCGPNTNCAVAFVILVLHVFSILRRVCVCVCKGREDVCVCVCVFYLKCYILTTLNGSVNHSPL